jgi:hypothetical protein
MYSGGELPGTIISTPIRDNDSDILSGLEAPKGMNADEDAILAILV